MGYGQPAAAGRWRSAAPEPLTQRCLQQAEQQQRQQQQQQQWRHVRRSSPRRLDSILSLAVATAVLSTAVLPYGCHAALPCERSGYCSLGRTKPFVGEVDSSLGLRAALASRSFRRELILMASDSANTLPIMQAVGNLLRLGLEHVMVMGSSGPDCVALAAAVPTAGCVWLDFELPVLGADREYVVPAIPMWHNRYRIAARAVRLQYNVFIVDTDVIFFDDPYLYFKSPPFANFTIINQPELLYEQGGYGKETEPNGGVLYVQGAQPDGAAAWLLAEVTHRLLRWIDDGFNTTSRQHGMATWCNYMDQDALRDAISSVLLGRLFFGASVRDCRTDEWRAAHAEEHAAIVAAVQAATRPSDHYVTEEVVLPEWMRAVAGGPNTTLRHFAMRLPAHAPWDSSFGPYLLPQGPRGRLAEEWLQQLRDDCGCPLWPDPEDPASATTATTTSTTAATTTATTTSSSPSSPSPASSRPLERYLLAPPFLMLNWFARGRLGYWHRALTPGGPQQVVGHLHYIPGTDAATSKAVAKMAVGQYDWTLARQVLGRKPYFLYESGGPPPHQPLSLLALHPSVDLGATGSWQEYTEILAGLAMVAIATGRTPVWPDVPCSAPWVAEGGPQGAASLPLDIRMEWIPYGRRPGSLSCVWLALLDAPCLAGGTGMLGLEWAHWRSAVRMRHSLEPGEHNTIGLPDDTFGPLPRGSSPASRVFNVPYHEVAAAWGLRKTHAHRVLYLASPLNVTFPPNIGPALRLYGTLLDCRALNPGAVEGDLVDKPYKQPHPPQLAWVPAAVGPDGRIRPAPAMPGYNVPRPSNTTTTSTPTPTHVPTTSSTSSAALPSAFKDSSLTEGLTAFRGGGAGGPLGRTGLPDAVLAALAAAQAHDGAVRPAGGGAAGGGTVGLPQAEVLRGAGETTGSGTGETPSSGTGETPGRGAGSALHNSAAVSRAQHGGGPFTMGNGAGIWTGAGAGAGTRVSGGSLPLGAATGGSGDGGGGRMAAGGGGSSSSSTATSGNDGGGASGVTGDGRSGSRVGASGAGTLPLPLPVGKQHQDQHY